MLLSIIVPTLDGRVPESVKCAVEGRPEVELVVVKGVSPVGKARNEGLRRAKGEYIAWVDSDDEVGEEWLEEILNSITLYAPEVITFDVKCDKWVKTTQWSELMSNGTCSGLKLTRAIYYDCALVNTLWMYVTRRGLWEGLQFDEEIARGEDYLILPKVMVRAREVRYIAKALYHYRENNSSIMHQERNDHQRQYMELSFRRYEEAPLSCKAAARFGAGSECYWLMNGVALGKNKSCSQEVYARCRGWIRSQFSSLFFHTLVDRGLSSHDRMVWPIKFMVAAIDCWWGLKAK